MSQFEKDERLQVQSFSVLSILRVSTLEWMLNTTVHGIPKIVKGRHVVFQIFWFICFVVSAGICAYIVTTVVFFYLQYPTNTNIATVFETESEFPMVALCNLNAINNKAGYKAASNYPFTSPATFSGYTLVKFTATRTRESLAQVSSANKSYYGLTMKDMLISCTFYTAVCTYMDFEQFYDQTYGNCYKFNSGKDYYGNTTTIKTVSYSGYQYGLILELFVGAQSKTDYLSYAQGMMVVIDNSSSYPLLQDEGYYLPTGRINQIQVDRVFAYKMAAPYSSCIKDVSSSSSYTSAYYKQVFEQSSVYSQKLCLKMCYQMITAANCSCQDPETIPAYTNFTECANSTQLDCRNTMRTALLDSSFLSAYCLPDCPRECDTIDYRYTMSSATFPSVYYANYLLTNSQSSIKNYFNASSASYTDVANSVMIVSVYYEELAYTVYSDTPALTLILLLSNFGGYLGLFMGVSVLSILEVFEVLVIILFEMVSNSFKKHRNARRPKSNRIEVGEPEKKIKIGLPPVDSTI